MSEKNKDNLEQFFNSRLKGSSNTGDWNKPSDDIFYSAMDVLDKQHKKPQSKNRWLPLVFLLALLFLIGGIYLFVKYNELKKENLAIAAQSKAIKANNADLTDQLIKLEESIIEKDTQIDLLSNELILSQIETALIKDRLTASQQHTRKLSSRLVALNEENKKLSEAQELVLESTGAHDGVPKFKEAIFIDNLLHIESLGLTKLDKLKNSFALPLNTNTFSSDREEKKSAWTLSLGAALVSSALEMNDLAVQNFSLWGYEKYQSGHGLNASLSNRLTNRLSLRFDLAWTKLYNNSTYESQLKYDMDKQFESIDGQLLYRNQMDVLSPIGTIQMNDVVELNDEIDPQANSNIAHATEIDLDYHIVSASVGMGIELFKRKRLSIGGSLASQINYMVSAKAQMSTNLSIDNVEMSSYKSNTLSNSMSGTKHIYLSLAGGVALNYQLSPHWSASLNADYDHALGSIKQSNANDLSKTFIKKSGLRMGLNYAF